jgi:hypothetical protein
MATAFLHRETQSDSWAHRFWKKARKFAEGKSSRASRDAAAPAGRVVQVAEGNKSPQRRHRMKLSEYQKQMHEEIRRKKTDQLLHSPGGS